MALPTFVQAGTGSAITGASGSVSLASTTAGNIILLEYLLDGTGAFGGFTDVSNAEDLAGDDGGLTFITGMEVGSPQAGALRADIGRSLGGTVQVDFGSVTDDIFARLYEFTNCSAGTTVATVVENGGGQTGQEQGTSTTIADSGVTTNAAERLAIQLIAVTADQTLAAFAGESGGDWTEPVDQFNSGSGTGGTIGINTAEMTAAGTINGGTITITSNPWGVMGFALIGLPNTATVAWLTA